MSDKKSKIYFSYAWNDDKTEAGKSREDLVEKLYQSLKNDGFDVRRDKENCTYGESISNFIKEIGEGDLIVVFVSEKYAKSPYCMQELFLIAQNNKFDKSSFQNTILPIVVEFIKFDEPKVLTEYFEYWKNKQHEWQEFINNFPNHTRAQSERLHIAKDIQNQFGLLADWLADINASNNQLLQENDFEIVKKVIIERIGKQETKMKKEEEKNCPKTYEEFKEYVTKHPLPEVFEMIEKCFYQNMSFSNKVAFHDRQKQYTNDELGVFTTKIKEVLPMLVKDQF